MEVFFKGEEIGFDICKYYGLVNIFSMADCHGWAHVVFNFQHGPPPPHTQSYFLLVVARFCKTS